MRNNYRKKRKRIIIELIIAIIILLLITSCSAISYFGKIGRNTVETTTEIDDNTNDKQRDVNNGLTFDLEDRELGLVIYLQDGDHKLGFSTKGIKPKKFGCSTSDAKIATCIVKDGYIIIKPNKKGTVQIELSTETNGKKYIATTSVQIKSKKSSGSSNNKNTNSSNSSSSNSSSSTNRKNNGSVNSQNSNNNNKNNNNNNNSSNNNPSKDDNNKPTDDKQNENETDARLISLKVGNYELHPTFNSDVYEYVVNVPNDVDSVVVSGKTSSKKAVILSGLGTLQLKSLSTTHEVKVKAYNGTIKTYVIKINKKVLPDVLSSNANLKSLVIDGFSLEPEFSPNTYIYSTKVPYTISNLNVVALPEVSTSLVTISDSSLKVGTNVIKITVTAEDGTTKEYKIKVERLKEDKQNTNAYLKSLVVRNATLEPEFNKEVYTYNVSVDKNTNSLDLTALPEVDSSVVTITGNENFKTGKNIVLIKVKSLDGIEKTYEIIVNKDSDEDLDSFYINSNRSYRVGYNKNIDNYKNIIIDSNILDGNITSSYENGILTLTDGESKIILESSLNLSYLTDDNVLSHTINVSYKDTDVGSRTIKVTGIRKGNVINTYDITFNIVNVYEVIIDANGGFFNEFTSIYELLFYADEDKRLDLSEYNTAYKKVDPKNDCLVYKLESYNTRSDGQGFTYNLDVTDLKVTSDLHLYAIYSSKQTDYDDGEKRLYLVDDTVFLTSDGTKTIAPGINGSYIMHIKNTSSSRLTIKTLDIEEDNICVDNVCLNMGYIIKYSDDTTPNYKYVLGDKNGNYDILNKLAEMTTTNHYKKSLALDNIVLEPNEETEISLLWKWVDDDVNDKKIGDYVTPSNNTYSLTISYVFDKETMCGV